MDKAALFSGLLKQPMPMAPDPEPWCALAEMERVGAECHEVGEKVDAASARRPRP